MVGTTWSTVHVALSTCQPGIVTGCTAVPLAFYASTVAVRAPCDSGRAHEHGIVPGGAGAKLDLSGDELQAFSPILLSQHNRGAGRYRVNKNALCVCVLAMVQATGATSCPGLQSFLARQHLQQQGEGQLLLLALLR